MNIKELKALIENLPDEMEVVAQCYVESGRGGSGGVTCGPLIGVEEVIFYDGDDDNEEVAPFRDAEEDEEGTKVLNIYVSVCEQFYD